MQRIVDNVESVDKFSLRIQCIRKVLMNTEKVLRGGVVGGNPQNIHRFFALR